MRVASAAGVSPFGGARRCLARCTNGAANTRGMHRPRRPSTRHHAHRTPRGLPALTGRRVRHRLTPTGLGVLPNLGPQAPYRENPPHLVGARRCLARCTTGSAIQRVANTSRTTRSVDQPSGPLHDRPAVNGRAQSPSRLKPADPNGACTQPIDSGAWAPHSPLQGACGFSPGLQPRAHGWRPPPP
jgi:hypothetical protein